MSSGKNTIEDQIFHYEQVIIRQAILIAVDVSSSMEHTEDGQTKSNIKLAEEMINQIGQDPELTDDYKRKADICVMTFADHVTTEQDWMPLSEYRGGISLIPNEGNAFHDVVKQAIIAVRAMNDKYAKHGMDYMRPQIFIITVGYSTDPSANPNVVREAITLCQKYVDTKKVTMNVILLPGGSASLSKELSEKVVHYKIDDCVFGLPREKSFIYETYTKYGIQQSAKDNTVPLPKLIEIEKQSDESRTVFPYEEWC